MTSEGTSPKCYMCGKFLPHSPGVSSPGLCKCEAKTATSKREPELYMLDESEIVASIDPKGIDADNVFRPVFISQETESIALTIPDARRLLAFLNEAIPYLEARTWEH